MLVLAVIPARLSAKRLARKPLRLLGGEPLIVRVYERVVALGIADYVVVATDHPEVLAVCASRGISALLTRDDHPSGTDRVAEIAGRPEFAQYSVILNVQGDEPFVSRDALAGAVDIVVKGVAPIGTAASPMSGSAMTTPDVVKVVLGNDGRALYFSRASIPFVREPADAALQHQLARQHVGVYAYTPQALQAWVSWAPHPLELVERLEQLRPMAHGLVIGVADVPVAEGGIDTEDDLDRANLFWNALHTNTLP